MSESLLITKHSGGNQKIESILIESLLLCNRSEFKKATSVDQSEFTKRVD